MKKYFINFIKFALSLGVGVGVIIWFMGQMSDSDKQHVLADIKRANYFWVLVPPVINLISNYFRTARWRLMLRPLGYKPGFWNTYFSIMIMYFLNLLFPRLGEVSRCGILARYEKVPLDKSIGTMVIERLTDVICLGAMWIMLLIFEHDKFGQLYTIIVTNSSTTFGDIIAKYQISPQLQYGVPVAMFIGTVIFIFYKTRGQGWAHFMTGFKERVMGLIRGIISIKDIGSPWEFLFHTVMIWACYFVMSYLSFRIFPETSGLGFLAAASALFFGAVAYTLTPGGLGLYPIFMRIVLVLYGVAGSVAFSLGLVSWTVQTIAVLIVGVISYSLLLLQEQRKHPSVAPVNTANQII